MRRAIAFILCVFILNPASAFPSQIVRTDVPVPNTARFYDSNALAAAGLTHSPGTRGFMRGAGIKRWSVFLFELGGLFIEEWAHARMAERHFPNEKAIIRLFPSGSHTEISALRHEKIQEALTYQDVEYCRRAAEVMDVGLESLRKNAAFLRMLFMSSVLVYFSMLAFLGLGIVEVGEDWSHSLYGRLMSASFAVIAASTYLWLSVNRRLHLAQYPDTPDARASAYFRNARKWMELEDKKGFRTMAEVAKALQGELFYVSSHQAPDRVGVVVGRSKTNGLHVRFAEDEDKLGMQSVAMEYGPESVWRRADDNLRLSEWLRKNQPTLSKAVLYAISEQQRANEFVNGIAHSDPAFADAIRRGNPVVDDPEIVYAAPRRSDVGLGRVKTRIFHRLAAWSLSVSMILNLSPYPRVPLKISSVRNVSQTMALSVPITFMNASSGGISLSIKRAIGVVALAFLAFGSGIPVFAQQSASAPPVGSAAVTSSEQNQLTQQITQAARQLEMDLREGWNDPLPLRQKELQSVLARFLKAPKVKAFRNVDYVAQMHDETIEVNIDAVDKDFPLALLKALVAHELLHSTPSHRARYIQIRRLRQAVIAIVEKLPVGAPKDPNEKLTVKRFLAVLVEQEFDAYMMEYAYTRYLAGKLGLEMNAYYLQFSTQIKNPILKRDYAEGRSIFNSGNRDVPQLERRLRFNLITRSEPGLIPMISQMAVDEGIDPADRAKLREWLFSWLGNEAFFNFRGAVVPKRPASPVLQAA